MSYPANPQRRSKFRFALLAGLAAAGFALLAGCGEDAKGEASTTTPTTTVAPTTSVHTNHGTTVPVTDPPATTAVTEPTEPPATAPQDAPSQIDVVAKDYAFTLSSGVVAAGPVTFSLTNEGAEPHQMHIAAVPDGYTADQFVETFETEGEMAAFQDFVWSGGVNGVEPGATQVATAELAPGHYVVMCFIPTAGEHGMAHLEMGMVAELDAVDTGTVADPPLPVATVELSDFKIAIPDRFTGGVTEVINKGSANHEFILLRFHDGKSLADLAAWTQAGMPADRPFDYVGGTGTIAPGTKAWATLTLDPGDYVALCVVRGPSDQPHVDLGMLTPFKVGV
jgi:uncharacterized cupredoxin-like copper-binding protein